MAAESNAGARLAGLPPVFDAQARVLVLGSFPGLASLGANQYYAHPRNQFWPILSRLIGDDLLRLDYADRLRRAVAAGIAIWDVHQSCRRQGSLDSAIRDSEPNALASLVLQLPRLQAVAFNGKTAAGIGRTLIDAQVVRYELPSTSPAYAGLRFEDKWQAWSVLQQHLLAVGDARQMQAVPA